LTPKLRMKCAKRFVVGERSTTGEGRPEGLLEVVEVRMPV
jgi:hypothetical protein